MEIKTKYEIGQHIWVVSENRGEVSVYDDHISFISYDKNLIYCTKETYTSLEEEDIILYEEKEKLFKKIEQLMKEIREKENKT